MNARARLIRGMLGKPVHVEIDRPIGYLHGGTVYPVNYGYIPGVLGGDGEEQDVYVLGVEEPISSFDGRIIGAVRRFDDCEDKLVAAPEGMLLHQGQIAEAVYFQEQYFSHAVDSLLHKSCGVIPYRQTAAGREYLILLQNNGSWSFPKGHMERGETEIQTALRELREETGLTALPETESRICLDYPIPPLLQKQVVLFPARVSGTLKLQETEIRTSRWVSLAELSGYLHPDTCAACIPHLK